MKKNIIFLLIDCFDYNKIGANTYRPSPTPFLDYMKEHSYWASNMYSLAPYTEAALIATICGYSTLDRGGHLKRYKNCPQTIYEMVQNSGYEVYAQMWTHFYPSSALRGIDDVELRPYSFSVLWHYRIKYFSELYKSNKIEEEDFFDLIDIIKENLYHWLDYLYMLENRDKRVRMVIDNMILPNISDNIEKLKYEIDEFNKNPHAYVESLLENGDNHRIYQIFNDENLNHKVDENFSKKIHELYGFLGKDLFEISNKLNKKNNRISFKKIWQYLRSSNYILNLRERTQLSQYLRNYWHVTHDEYLLRKFDENYPCQKDCITARSMMEMFFKWRDERSEDQKPYFSYIHCEDIHGQSVVFDIGSNDQIEIKKQVDTLQVFVNSLDKSYRGNLAYDLGLLYIDNQIKWFYEELDKRGDLDNTTIIITADHGCGTNYYPLRGNVQNFHDECYHVPFIIIDKDINCIIDNDYHVTKDIMPTIAELIGVEPPKSSTGISVFSEQKRKIVIQEYMGPGCPDMYRREAWMCAFDEEWKLFIKVRLDNNKGFEYRIEEIFNRQEDPQEVDNRKWNKKDVRACDYLLKALEVRWREIVTNYSRDGKY